MCKENRRFRNSCRAEVGAKTKKRMCFVVNQLEIECAK